MYIKDRTLIINHVSVDHELKNMFTDTKFSFWIPHVETSL